MVGVVEDEHISVLEKIRLAMDHLEDEDNDDSNCSTHEAQDFFHSLTNAATVTEGSLSKENNNSLTNFRRQSQSPDSTSPVLDISPKLSTNVKETSFVDESTAAIVNEAKDNEEISTKVRIGILFLFNDTMFYFLNKCPFLRVINQT